MNGKLKNSPSDAQKFDGSCREVPRMHGKLMECPADVGKFNGTSWKAPQMHGNFLEIDGKSRRCMKS